MRLYSKYVLKTVVGTFCNAVFLLVKEVYLYILSFFSSKLDSRLTLHVLSDF